jgi:hypothetical protein
MDWFNVVFGCVGLFYLFSGIYEWKRIWKMGGWGYLPNKIGERNTRLIYMFSGFGLLGVAISIFLQDLLSDNSILFFIVGFTISASISAILFKYHEGTSIFSFVRNKKDKLL